MHFCPRSLLTLTALALALCSLPAPAQDQQGESSVVAKRIGLGDLFAASPRPAIPRLGAMSTAPTSNNEEYGPLLHPSPNEPITQAQFLELIRTVAGKSSSGGASAKIRNQVWLELTGDAKQVGRLEQAARAVLEVFRYRVHVHASLYRLERPLDAPAKLDQETFRKKMAGHPLLWSGSVALRSGQQGPLQNAKFTRYTRDYDVEVAENAGMTPPKTDSFFEGIQLLLEAHALVGTKEHLLRCQYAVCEQTQPLETIVASSKGAPRIEVPHLSASSGCFSGRVGTDEVLLLTITGENQNLALALRAEAGAGQTTEARLGNSLILPISGLTGNSLGFSAPPLEPDSEDPEGAWGGYSIRGSDEGSTNRSLDLRATLRVALGITSAADTETSTFTNGIEDGYLLVRGASAGREAVRKLLQQLQQERLRDGTVVLSTQLVKVAGTTGFFEPLPAAISAAAPARLQVSAPVLVGDTIVLISGLETTVVRDQQAEIAKGHHQFDPVVQTVFSGLELQAKSYPGTTTKLHVQGILQHVPSPRRVPMQDERLGDLFHVTIERALFQRNVPLLPTVQTLGWGPKIERNGKALRMLQTLRWTPGDTRGN